MIPLFRFIYLFLMFVAKVRKVTDPCGPLNRMERDRAAGRWVKPSLL